MQSCELLSASERGDVEAVTSLITAEVDLNAKNQVRFINIYFQHLIHIMTISILLRMVKTNQPISTTRNLPNIIRKCFFVWLTLTYQGPCIIS